MLHVIAFTGDDGQCERGAPQCPQALLVHRADPPQDELGCWPSTHVPPAAPTHNV